MGVYYPGKHVYFNGNDLTGIPGFLLQTIDPGQVPKRTMETYALARHAGEAVISTYFDYREIILKGAFVTTSQTLYEQGRDILMRYISSQSGVLQTDIGGIPRQYVCTMSDNSNLPEIIGGYASVELHFNAYDPFGYDVTPTNLFTPFTATSITSGNSATFNISGSAPQQEPVFNLTVNSLTYTAGQTTSTIYLTNAQTGQQVSITRAWAAGDVLTIDTHQNMCFVNGIAVAWAGAMPVFAPSNGNTMVYTDSNLTARSVTVSGSLLQRWV